MEGVVSINQNLEEQVASLYRAWFDDFIPFNHSFPNTWEYGRLGDISLITSGKRPLVKMVEKTNIASIPLVGAASIMGYTVNHNQVGKILVIGRVGTHGIVQRFNSPCWASDNTLVIKSDYFEYVYQILKRIDYQSLNRGSTQPLITQTDISNVDIIIPEPNVLYKFETLAGQLMTLYEAKLKENECLAALRDLLLPRLMSGDLDVANIEF